MKQRQVKKILKKQGKLKQEPTVQEAFTTLWRAISNDPEWCPKRFCLFIGQDFSHLDGSDRGNMYTAAPTLKVISDDVGK